MGEMADWLAENADLEDLQDGPTQGITCRHCGTTGLLWHEEPNDADTRRRWLAEHAERGQKTPPASPRRIWRLVDERGRYHVCP